MWGYLMSAVRFTQERCMELTNRKQEEAAAGNKTPSKGLLLHCF